MKLKYAAMVFIVMFAAGCQGFLEHAERETLDHEKTLKISRLRIKVVKDQICLVKGLGRAEELSVKAVEAMDEFLKITADPNNMTDCELVYSLGLGLQFYEACLLNVFPEFKRFWP